MTQLSVWIWDAPASAARAVRQVREQYTAESSRLYDGALVEWPQAEKNPRARQLDELAGPRALGVTFWDFLFGLVFVAPRLVGTPDPPLGDALVGLGIDNDFLDELRARVVPGTSALCLLGADRLAGALAEPWRQDCGEPLVAMLDEEHERALRLVFPRQGPPNRVSA